MFFFTVKNRLMEISILICVIALPYIYLSEKQTAYKKMS